MKKIILIIITLIIIIAGIFIIKNTSKNKYDYQISEVTDFNYYIYKQGESYGIINKEGEIKINAQYNDIIIPNPEKDIFVCYKGETPEILNSKGEILFTGYEAVEEIKLKNVASYLTYEKSVLKYKKDGKYGLIDFEGKVITKNIYDSIENLRPTEGKLLVSQDGKYGVIDIKGNVLVDSKYDNILSDEYYTEKEGYKKSGFIISNKTADGYRFGYVSYNGKKILDTNYNEINRISKENEENIYLIVSEEGKYGLYKENKKIIENEYQEITYDDNLDLILIQKNKKYGVATLDGKIIIDIKNDEITSRGIYLYAKENNNQKVYDKNGNAIEINFNKSIYLTENEEYRITTFLNNDTTYYGIINKNGVSLVEEKYKYIEYLFGNYFIATNEEGKIGVINSNGNVVLDMKYNSLQKIKGKNIIYCIQPESNITEFYSEKLEKTASIEKAIIHEEKDYIIVSSEEEKTYLNEKGEIINDISSLPQSSFPDEIANYKKQQITIENVYYTQK